jgi:serine/threonine-protein kinase RsbW
LTTHRDTDPCTTVHLPHELASIPRARHMMCEELVSAGLRQSLIHDAELVLSELVTNAIAHGEPNDGAVEISWCIDEDHLRISVLDGGSAADLAPVELSDHALNGRGLAIVDYLCDRWSHDHDLGTRVTAELHYGSSQPTDEEGS